MWLFCLFQLRNDVNFELSHKFPSASCLRKCSIHQAHKHSGPFTALKRLARLNFELLPNAKVVPSAHIVLESEFNRGIVLLCDIEKSMLLMRIYLDADASPRASPPSLGRKGLASTLCSWCSASDRIGFWSWYSLFTPLAFGRTYSMNYFHINLAHTGSPG